MSLIVALSIHLRVIPTRRVRRRATVRRAEKAYVPRDGVQLHPPAAHARAALDGDSECVTVAVAVALVAVEQQAHAAPVREALVAALAQLRAH